MGTKLKYTAPSHGVGVFSFIFHLASKAKCVSAWQTEEQLVWSCWKLLTRICIIEQQWEISVGLCEMGDRALLVGIQGGKRKFTGSGKYWGQAPPSLFPVCQPKHPIKYSSLLQHSDSLQPLPWPERPLYHNQTIRTSLYLLDILIPSLSSSSPSDDPQQRKHFLSPVIAPPSSVVTLHTIPSYTPAFPAALAQLIIQGVLQFPFHLLLFAAAC